MFMNEAAYGLDAGIRLDTESLCHRWSPTLELLTRDEIERREGDRERQLRRLKRDTARFGGISSIAVVEEEILGSGRRRLKRKRSTSPAGRGTPRGGHASRADSPSLVDVSISKASSLTDSYVLHFSKFRFGANRVGNGQGGDVRIVWFLGQGQLQLDGVLMGQKSCAIIVVYGMHGPAKCPIGDEECMQLARKP